MHCVTSTFFVGHVELTTHLIAAIILLSYTLWFALSLLPSMNEKIYNKKIGSLLITILILLMVQLIYGGFMAGLKAASTAPTWPSINGEIIPAQINELSPWIQNIFNNKIAIHFIHRGMAYLLFIFVIVFYIKSKILIYNQLFKKLRISFLFLIFLQVILGIFALLNATNNSLFIWIGVAHQFTAIMLVMCLIALLFLVRRTTVVVKA